MKLSSPLILAALIIILLYPQSLVRAEGEIEITLEEVVSDFPDALRFQVSATSPDGIEDIKVVYRLEGADTSSYGYVDLTPGKEVSGEYELRTSGGGAHVPPGTAFNYVIEVYDKGGGKLRTEEKQVIYMDNRFEWSEISDGPVTVYYYGPTESRAQTILRVTNMTVEQMGQVLGLEAVPPIRVIAYNNSRHMAAALPPRSAAIRQDLITEGQAWPDKRVVLVMAFSPQVEGIGSHEIVHVVVADATKAAYGVVPTWLNEGLAEYGNLDPGITYDQALNYAIYTRKLKPLWYLARFSGDPNDIIIGYGQARSVVQYLVRQYGPEKIAALMKALQETMDIDRALQKIYAFDTYGLDSQWRLSLGLDPFPSPEEIERQAQGQGQVTSTATATPSPTPEPAPDTARAEMAPEEARPSPGCSIQPTPEAAASLPIDLAILGLLGGPLSLFSLRWIRRNRDD